MMLSIVLLNSFNSCSLVSPSSSFRRFYSMVSILLLAMLLRYFMSSLVSTDVCMPEVDDTSFYLLFASRISTFMCSSFECGATVLDMHSLLSFSNMPTPTYFYSSIFSLTPLHRTNPPQTDLDALPEPNLANSDNYTSFSAFPKSPFNATARQASPEAEEAIPEAVGNEFTESISK